MLFLRMARRSAIEITTLQMCARSTDNQDSGAVEANVELKIFVSGTAKIYIMPENDRVNILCQIWKVNGISLDIVYMVRK
jgi:hypothetical protein